MKLEDLNLSDKEKIETAARMLFYMKWEIKHSSIRTNEGLIWLIDNIIELLEV